MDLPMVPAQCNNEAEDDSSARLDFPSLLCIFRDDDIVSDAGERSGM